MLIWPKNFQGIGNSAGLTTQFPRQSVAAAAEVRSLQQGFRRKWLCRLLSALTTLALQYGHLKSSSQPSSASLTEWQWLNTVLLQVNGHPVIATIAQDKNVRCCSQRLWQFLLLLLIDNTVNAVVWTAAVSWFHYKNNKNWIKRLCQVRHEKEWNNRRRVSDADYDANGSD